MNFMTQIEISWPKQDVLIHDVWNKIHDAGSEFHDVMKWWFMTVKIFMTRIWIHNGKKFHDQNLNSWRWKFSWPEFEFMTDQKISWRTKKTFHDQMVISWPVKKIHDHIWVISWPRNYFMTRKKSTFRMKVLIPCAIIPRGYYFPPDTGSEV